MFTRQQALDFLLNAGCTDGDNDGYSLTTNNFNIRISGDEIQFGYKRLFDRWANSVDFVLYHIPTGIEDIEQLLIFAILKGFYNPGSGERLELSPIIRQFKRELAIERAKPKNKDFKFALPRTNLGTRKLNHKQTIKQLRAQVKQTG